MIERNEVATDDLVSILFTATEDLRSAVPAVAMASARAGCTVRGWDIDPRIAARAASRSALTAYATSEEAVTDADVVIVCTPIGTVASSVASALRAAPGAVVADAASIKEHVVAEIRAVADPADLRRYVPSHPLGGSERS